MLLHQDAGAFTITLFAAPQPLHTGAADLSVMVQDRSSGEVLLDPVIDLTVAPETANATAADRSAGERAGEQPALAGIHGAFSSRRQVARNTGWSSAGNDVAQLSTECTVEPDQLPRYAGVVLYFVAGRHHSVVCHPPGFEASAPR